MPDPEIRNGLLVAGNSITHRRIANLEGRAFDWTQTVAIIVHQTWTASAEATISVWQDRPYGTHFLIDRGTGTYPQTRRVSQNPERYEYTGTNLNYTGTDGRIFQTASLDRRSQHMASNRSFSITNAEGNQVLLGNGNTIGIELVSMFDPVADTYPPISPAQVLSTADLINILLRLIPRIGSEHVYAHPTVSRKHATEAVSALEAIRPHITRPTRNE